MEMVILANIIDIYMEFNVLHLNIISRLAKPYSKFLKTISINIKNDYHKISNQDKALVGGIIRKIYFSLKSYIVYTFDEVN